MGCIPLFFLSFFKKYESYDKTRESEFDHQILKMRNNPNLSEFEQDEAVVALQNERDLFTKPHYISIFWGRFNEERFRKNGLDMPFIQGYREAEVAYNVVKMTNQQNFSLLISKAAAKEVEMDKQSFRCILMLTPNINAQNKEGNAALHLAVIKGNRDFAEILLESKASTSLQNNQGATVLHLAANKENTVFVDMLAGAGADPRVRDKEELIPLGVAQKYSRHSCVKALTAYEERYNKGQII
jgi:hypothetical protein